MSETRIAATPETVFSFFIDPNKMVRWMGSRAEADPRPGGTYALDINTQARARGEFLEVVPYSRVVFTFGWDGDQGRTPGRSRRQHPPVRSPSAAEPLQPVRDRLLQR